MAAQGIIGRNGTRRENEAEEYRRQLPDFVMASRRIVGLHWERCSNDTENHQRRVVAVRRGLEALLNVPGIKIIDKNTEYGWVAVEFDMSIAEFRRSVSNVCPEFLFHLSDDCADVSD